MKQDSQVHVCEFKYEVEASLWGVTNPTISRTLSLRHTATFEELHEALHIAFCWRPTTKYYFGMGKVLISSAEQLVAVSMNEDEKARFDKFQDASKTYIAEAMKNRRFDRRILGYSYVTSSEIVHYLRIRAIPLSQSRSGYLPDVRCVRGIGHPFAQGFDLKGWMDLKDAYKKERPNS